MVIWLFFVFMVFLINFLMMLLGFLIILLVVIWLVNIFGNLIILDKFIFFFFKIFCNFFCDILVIILYLKY